MTGGGKGGESMRENDVLLLAVLRDLTECIDALTDELRDTREEMSSLTREVDELGDNVRDSR